MNYIAPSIFPDNIVCAYSTKAYGELEPFREKGDGLQDSLSPETIKNRDNFLGDLGTSRQSIIQVKQFHSDKVLSVGEQHAGRGYIEEADGMITTDKNIALSVFSSDCLPVFLYDPINRVIATAHAGWRGVYNQIIRKTITKMIDEYGSDTQDILVWIGPHVLGETYCFDISHYDDSPANAYFESMGGITYADNTFCVDLGLVAHKQLQEIGVPQENIEQSEIDTKTSEHLYSYQAGDRTNNVGIILMK